MPGKAIQIKPLTGIMDTRSTPDEVPFGGYRYVQNWRVTHKNKLCRRNGFVRHLDREDYNNQDLHDQLFGNDEQVISMLFQATSSSGQSKLIAGTQSRLYSLNNDSGNWVQLTDSMGGPHLLSACSELRFHAAQIGDYVALTNGYDEPVYYIIDQPEFDGSSVDTISELREVGITKAAVVVGWKGLLIFANVVSDGIRVEHRIIWSDFQRPLSFSPTADSVSGYVDLGSGEAIVAIKPLGDVLLVYTNTGIWQGTVSGGDDVLSFTRRYSSGERNNRCLAYPNTLVSTGSDHYYMGVDGIYVYNMFLSEPSRPDWIHRASGSLYEGGFGAGCRSHVGGFNAQTKEVLFSWTNADEECPSQTIVLNTEYPFVDIMDHGFSTFVNYGADVVITLRTFLQENCICTEEELDELGQGYNNEGGFCNPPVAPVCEDPPVSIYTTNPLTIGDVTTEDYTQVSADPDSLCAYLEGKTLEDLCGSSTGTVSCESGLQFLMVSTEDNCIKQFSPVFYREICTNKTGCGTYVANGYVSILRSGPLDFKVPDDPKRMYRFEVEAHFATQTVPSQFSLRVGHSARVADPNVEGCGVRWLPSVTKDIECLSAESATNPNKAFEWPVYVQGNNLYFELSVVNSAVTPANTGGDVCLSRAALDILQLPTNRLT